MSSAGLDVAPPPLSLQSELKRKADSLAMLPEVARQAMDIARDPSRGIADFSAVVERDLSLTASILKLANSPLFAPTQSITSLHQAVTRIGIRQCKNLILTASIGSLMRKLSNEQVAIREHFFRHSFLTALLAVAINRELRLGFFGEEFTAGLIHDLGRTLLAIAAPPETFEQADPVDFDELDDVLIRERNILGSDHCALGAWYASENDLPDELIACIMFHHDPAQAPEEHRRLVLLTSTADHISNHLQRALDVERYELESNLAFALLAKSSRPGTLDRMRDAAPDLIQKSVQDCVEMMSLSL
jgi:HD-like signal output (HDOD) protein